MSAIQRPPLIEHETKLKTVRQGAKYAFPTADIERMLNEIERGFEPNTLDTRANQAAKTLSRRTA